MQSVTRSLKRNLSSKNLIKDRLALALKNKDWSAIEELQDLISKALDKPNNLVMMGDAYKYSHHKFYEDNTSKIYSYLESRGGKFSETVFFGLQYFLKTYLEGVAITQEDLEEAYEYLGTKYGVFGREDVFDKSKFQYIIDTYGGRLPISIKAVPEGTIIGTKNVLLTIENTDPECYWLTNFLETILLQVWYPITVATLSHEIKKIVYEYFDKTSNLPREVVDIVVEFVLNDFGFRGVSSVQSASIGGAAHLVSFMGSDNTVASQTICDIYNTDRVFGLSVPATEHSIMTMKGEAGEVEMMKRTLLKYPTGIVACVSDSYNILRACSEYWGTELRDLVLSRPAEAGNQLVIRPDSGDPVDIICGHGRTELTDSEKRAGYPEFYTKGLIECLWEIFGGTINDQGYKVLDPHIGAIYGDSITIARADEICARLEAKGFASTNVVLGIGSFTYQYNTRDTFGFAMKATYVEVNDEGREIFKDPITDDGTKKSATGLLHVTKANNEYMLVDKVSWAEEAGGELQSIYYDGEFENQTTLTEIKNRLK
jgi:nicotinamide phosphoribosyltransferase